MLLRAATPTLATGPACGRRRAALGRGPSRTPIASVHSAAWPPRRQGTRTRTARRRIPSIGPGFTRASCSPAADRRRRPRPGPAPIRPRDLRPGPRRRRHRRPRHGRRPRRRRAARRLAETRDRHAEPTDRARRARQRRPARRGREPRASSAILVATPTGVRRVSGVCVRNGEVITSASAIDGATALTVVGADGSRRAGDARRPGPVDPARARPGRRRLGPGQARGERRPPGRAVDPRPRRHRRLRAVGRDRRGRVDRRLGRRRLGLAERRDDHRRRGDCRPRRRAARCSTATATSSGSSPARRSDEMGGLATPIATVRDVAAQLAATGKAAHGALGVRTADEDHPRGARVVVGRRRQRGGRGRACSPATWS